MRPDRMAAVLQAGLILAVVALIVPALAHALKVWSTDEEFTYGFLIVPISLAIVWWRRRALRDSMGDGKFTGLAIVLAAIVVMLISRRLGINALGGVAVTPLLIGMVVFVGGWRAGRVVAFPATFLIFGLGLYRGMLSSLGFALQDLTARGAALAANSVGLGVLRDGLVLHSTSSSPEWAFIVAQTCSGMSSLLSLLALAVLWIYATRGPLLGKAAVILGVAPLVIIANTTRVTLVLAVASFFGQDAALGFFHGASSLVLFGLALSGLLVLSRTAGCKLPALGT